MRKEYDFSKARKNPYARRLKQQITLRIDKPTIEYFRSLSEGSGIPYQTLINLYLRECAVQRRKLSVEVLRQASSGPTPVKNSRNEAAHKAIMVKCGKRRR